MKAICLVEPHADTATLEADLLRQAGFEVRVVPASDAAADLDKDGVGLLLVSAGPRDGVAASTLLAKATMARIPVIVTTTQADCRRKWPAAAAVLLKPFDFDELLSEVRSHFRAD
jgi:DNA-binding response OmpR family regulator